MKRNKLLLTVFIVLCSIFMCFSVSAENDSDVIVSLQINNPVMEINGAETQIDAERSTTPVIIGGRTLVPIRAIVEAFGGEVGWDGSTKTVLLNMESNSIRLTIDSYTAYLNNSPVSLDTAPAVINDRTMLPIRFIAESFNLGVAWDGDTQTVFIIRNSFDDEEYNALMNTLPSYSGSAYTHINNNKPYFKEYEIIPASFEYYSDLDDLGRCDVCFSSVATDLMPTEERESISSVKPTGWVNNRYDNVPGGYIYNRCHLIGFQLTGENANKRNLITGTRYLNIEGMLPFENMVDDYIDSTGNRVMYRVTPVFSGNNLLADGVLMEAYSVEDNGRGISFCVYCYNVQPQIKIDYSTGANSSEYDPTPPAVQTPIIQTPIVQTPTEQEPAATVIGKIYRTPTGKRYHLRITCGGKNSYEVTLSEALAAGITPCAKCAK